jgi:ribosome recycling factor
VSAPRIPIPPLNQERRKEYVKLLHKMAEDARVSIRHARQEARDDVKQKIKDHEIPEDEGRRQQDEAQKLTDQYIGKIDDLLKHKEAEVMQV